ncbi:MAG TPA: hypothetical protein DEB12_07605 [Porphyromonadaceae bacterium]|jgi:transposase-like protein|nr:hypothetical protein [Porphyromonadaceae bacterium]
MERRKHKTKEEKQILLNKYLDSGLSKNEWCRKNNIPVSTLIGWEKQLNKVNKNEVIFVSPKPSKGISKEKTRPPVANDKVSDAEVSAFTTILEIEECKLHINENIPFHFISQLIKAVREAHV